MMMKVKVSYKEFMTDVGLVVKEYEVTVPESSMTVLFSRLDPSNKFVQLGNLILRLDSIQKVEKLQ